MNTYHHIPSDTINQVMSNFALSVNEKKLIGIEKTLELLKIVQKFTPKGISVIRVGNQVKLQFSKPTEKRSKHSINEIFNEPGLYNALDKAYGVFNALKQFNKLSDFNQWFDTEISQLMMTDDIVTVGKAIETVKTNYFNGSHNGISRNNPEFVASFQGNFDKGYNRTFKHLLPYFEQRLTATLLIDFIESRFSHLGKSKGFKTHVTNCQKLLIDSRLTLELEKFKEHFGKLEVTQKTEMQSISLELFLDFRDRVLGLNNYQLTKSQLRNIETRKSWFKALSINLIYGFRGSEFMSIINLDKPVTIGDRTFKALHNMSNDDNILVLQDYYNLIDDSGNIHKITIKTGKRITRPMIHPDYPNLIEILGIKDSSIKLPNPTPKFNSSSQSIIDLVANRLNQVLSRYIDQCGLGFTQTHALRHLCNYHGKLLGLTTEQRAKSLGHSVVMNDTVYDKHLTVSEQVNFLTAQIDDSSVKIARLETENKHLREQLEFDRKRIIELEQLLLSYNKPDNVIILNPKH